jgi:hypothetical protein
MNNISFSRVVIPFPKRLPQLRTPANSNEILTPIEQVLTVHRNATLEKIKMLLGIKD